MNRNHNNTPNHGQPNRGRFQDRMWEDDIQLPAHFRYLLSPTESTWEMLSPLEVPNPNASRAPEPQRAENNTPIHLRDAFALMVEREADGGPTLSEPWHAGQSPADMESLIFSTEVPGQGLGGPSDEIKRPSTTASPDRPKRPVSKEYRKAPFTLAAAQIPGPQASEVLPLPAVPQKAGTPRKVRISDTRDRKRLEAFNRTISGGKKLINYVDTHKDLCEKMREKLKLPPQVQDSALMLPAVVETQPPVYNPCKPNASIFSLTNILGKKKDMNKHICRGGKEGSHAPTDGNLYAAATNNAEYVNELLRPEPCPDEMFENAPYPYRSPEDYGIEEPAVPENWGDLKSEIIEWLALQPKPSNRHVVGVEEDTYAYDAEYHVPPTLERTTEATRLLTHLLRALPRNHDMQLLTGLIGYLLDDVYYQPTDPSKTVKNIAQHIQPKMEKNLEEGSPLALTDRPADALVAVDHFDETERDILTSQIQMIPEVVPYYVLWFQREKELQERNIQISKCEEHIRGLENLLKEQKNLRVQEYEKDKAIKAEYLEVIEHFHQIEKENKDMKQQLEEQTKAHQKATKIQVDLVKNLTSQNLGYQVTSNDLTTQVQGLQRQKNDIIQKWQEEMSRGAEVSITNTELKRQIAIFEEDKLHFQQATENIEICVGNPYLEIINNFRPDIYLQLTGQIKLDLGPEYSYTLRLAKLLDHTFYEKIYNMEPYTNALRAFEDLLKGWKLQLDEQKQSIEKYKDELLQVHQLVPERNKELAEEIRRLFLEDTAEPFRNIISHKDTRPFSGLGMGENIPLFLQTTGIVKHRYYSKPTFESFMKKFWNWRDTKMQDFRNPIHGFPFDEQVDTYMTDTHKRNGTANEKFEFAYSLIFSLETYKSDPDFYTFANILDHTVPPTIVDDQKRLLERFKHVLQECDCTPSAQPDVLGAIREIQIGTLGGKDGTAEVGGMTNFRIVNAVINQMFPDKSPQRIDAIRVALQKAVRSATDNFSIDEIFQEDSSGGQSPLVEEIRSQHVREVMEYQDLFLYKVRKIKTNMAKGGSDDNEDGLTTYLPNMSDEELVIIVLREMEPRDDWVEIWEIYLKEYDFDEVEGLNPRDILDIWNQHRLFRPSSLWVEILSSEVSIHGFTKSIVDNVSERRNKRPDRRVRTSISTGGSNQNIAPAF